MKLFFFLPALRCREMNSQCPPCSCLGETAQSNPCAVAAPEQNSQADSCLSQDVCPSCDPTQVPLGDSGPCVDPVKIPSSGEEPFTFETPGMCTMKFPLQKSILTVELCPADSFPLPQEELCATETCLENLEKLTQELPTVEPCTLEVVELDTVLGDPCTSQSGISMDPCSSQSGISIDPCASQTGISMDPCASQSGISADSCASQTGISIDPCAPQTGISVNPCTSQTEIPCGSQSQGFGDAGDSKDSKSQPSPRSPFRLNTCTSSIVERCLSRCQNWFRGKK